MDSAAKMSFSPFCEQGLSTILTGETIGPAAIEVRLRCSFYCDYSYAYFQFQGQIEERMSSDLGSEEHVSSFLSKALKDVPNHQYFAIVLQKVFNSNWLSGNLLTLPDRKYKAFASITMSKDWAHCAKL